MKVVDPETAERMRALMTPEENDELDGLLIELSKSADPRVRRSATHTLRRLAAGLIRGAERDGLLEAARTIRSGKVAAPPPAREFKVTNRAERRRAQAIARRSKP